MPALTKDDRDRLIKEYYRLDDEFRRRSDAPFRERTAFKEARNDVLGAYFEALPRRVLSRCPYSRAPFVHSFDPWGIDGFWWQAGLLTAVDEPVPPPTFRVLQGAVHLNDLPPVGGRAEALLGPEVPFVIPRILEMPTMVAVVASVPLANGYTAYPIAYFSQEPPPPGSLTQTWRTRQYSFERPDGRWGWTVATDPWDFDLEPWVERGKLRWVEPGDEAFDVQTGTWTAYPYRDVTGRQEPLVIRDGELYTEPPPDGTPAEPFE